MLRAEAIMTNSYESDARKDAGGEFHALDAAHAASRAVKSMLREMSERKSTGEGSLNGLLSNKLLKDLPDEDFARLLPDLEPVWLPFGENLYELEEKIPFVYFPENAIVSHLHILEDGSTTETAMIGKEGMVGLSAIFGSRPPARWTQVTLAGAALKMKTEVLRQEFARGGAAQHLLLAYASARLTQLSQRAVCNARHTVGERLSCWLLMIHDRAGDDHLPLTQEQIARHLGARRASISEAAKTLRDEQAISYSRGHINVLDRQLLEAAACECYPVLKETPNDFLL